MKERPNDDPSSIKYSTQDWQVQDGWMQTDPAITTDEEPSVTPPAISAQHTSQPTFPALPAQTPQLASIASVPASIVSATSAFNARAAPAPEPRFFRPSPPASENSIFRDSQARSDGQPAAMDYAELSARHFVPDLPAYSYSDTPAYTYEPPSQAYARTPRFDSAGLRQQQAARDWQLDVNVAPRPPAPSQVCLAPARSPSLPPFLPPSLDFPPALLSAPRLYFLVDVCPPGMTLWVVGLYPAGMTP
jgi:hypothetical protein